MEKISHILLSLVLTTFSFLCPLRGDRGAREGGCDGLVQANCVGDEVIISAASPEVKPLQNGIPMMNSGFRNSQVDYRSRSALSAASDLLKNYSMERTSPVLPDPLQQRGKAKFRVLITASNNFPQLTNVHTDTETNITTATGFCIEVFETALRGLDEEMEVTFIPWINGSYDSLVYRIFLEEYDAAVGDISITANRSKYVDFTLPFTDIGLGIVILEKNNMWIFLRPLTGYLWIVSGGFFILTGIMVWLIERQVNPRFRGSISEQIGMIFWFGFSTLIFAQRERLSSNLSRFIVVIWFFVVLILVSSYTAMLTSMVTLQQAPIKLSQQGSVGHHSDSYITEQLEAIGFNNQNLKPLSTPEDYANALTEGSKNGGVTSIVDELPYLKVFFSIYPSSFSLVGKQSTTNGFGFVFQKGSKLVHEMSQQIAKLRSEGELQRMEKKWFDSQLTNKCYDKLEPLGLFEFRGLFMMSGLGFILVLVLYWMQMMRTNWEVDGNISSMVVMPFQSSHGPGANM